MNSVAAGRSLSDQKERLEKQLESEGLSAEHRAKLQEKLDDVVKKLGAGGVHPDHPPSRAASPAAPRAASPAVPHHAAPRHAARTRRLDNAMLERVA